MARLDGPTILSQGDVLGSYQLLMPIGAGGMGRVWVARRLNSPTHQFVAVKTALDELSGDPEFERVFVDEARIASSIVHPNVCTIYEMGAERSVPYLVMEWINGGSLHDVLNATDGRKIDYFIAARIIANVCSGLQAAHELTDLDGSLMGVVHRDVSPQNILISELGHVKVVDFGVARAKGQLHKPTETGELKGKLSYMAPEQLTGRNFDRRADLFALGCVLFQATTGHRPFHGNDALETMYKLLETECEQPRALCPDYPLELEAIVCRALSKSAETRYQTAEQLERDLEKFLTAHEKLITDRDIAGLISSTLSPLIARREENLRVAVQSVEHPGQTVRPGGKTKTSSAKSPPEGSLGPVTQRSTSGQPGNSERPSELTANTRGTWESFRPHITPSRSTTPHRLWFILGTIAVLLPLGGWLGTLSPNRLRPSTSNQTDLRMTPTEGTSAKIEISVRAIPTDAVLKLDQDAPRRGSLRMTTSPTTVVHQLTVSADGYETRQVSLTFDRSRDELIELTALAKPVPVEPLSNVPSNPRSSNALKTTNTLEPANTETSKTLDPNGAKNRKPKRKLDPTNPFAEP